MTAFKVLHTVRLNGKGKGSIEYLGTCESCEANPARSEESKYCESCVDEFKESDTR